MALDFFRWILRKDSTYVLAWSGLADAVALSNNYGYEVPASVAPPPTRRAVALDSTLAEVHASLGLVYIVEHQAPPAALRELRRAVTLRPSYAQARPWLGELVLLLGQPTQAREHASLAVDRTLVHPLTGTETPAQTQLRRLRNAPDDCSPSSTPCSSEWLSGIRGRHFRTPSGSANRGRLQDRNVVVPLPGFSAPFAQMRAMRPCFERSTSNGAFGQMDVFRQTRVGRRGGNIEAGNVSRPASSRKSPSYPRCPHP